MNKRPFERHDPVSNDRRPRRAAATAAFVGVSSVLAACSGGQPVSCERFEALGDETPATEATRIHADPRFDTVDPSDLTTFIETRGSQPVIVCNDDGKVTYKTLDL